MCEPSDGGSLTRRGFLVLGGLGAAAGLLLPMASTPHAAAHADGVSIGAGHVILPRDVWGADLPPTGPMKREAPGDVRFLLVHHSASPNDYSAEQSIRYLRSFYHYHTSAAKGWPDIAYNFLVDEHGQIFEGRQGSIEWPVRGDATGGSQGFALLTCFIGNHQDVAPTEGARSAMVALLAWLADAYDIDPRPGSTAEFVSRGSNLHPEGRVVVTPTITGHRTMSRTTCPGDRVFDLVQNSFPHEVTAALSGVAPASAATAVSSTVAKTPTPTTSPEPVTSPRAETSETTVEAPGEAATTAVVSTPPPAPNTTEPYDPAPSTYSTSPVYEGEEAVEAPATSMNRDAEPAGDRSRRLLDMVWAGIGTAMLGALLWLRRRADPSAGPGPER